MGMPQTASLPRALRPGDTITIVAPSGAVDPAQLQYGIALFERAGSQVRIDSELYARRGYLAGSSDTAVAAALSAAFADPTIGAIICAKGGYGAIRILPYIDWEAIRANPKPFCGFSDITALHQAIRRETGLVTFHGPMAALMRDEEPRDWNDADLLRALTSTEPLGAIAAPVADDTTEVEALMPGTAEGLLHGGNVGMLAALCGTRWQPRFDGCLVLLEDTNEAPYRMDRVLTQLLLAGALDGARGIVFGDSPTCDRPPSERGRTLREVLLDGLGPLGVPLIYGFPCGHTTYRATLPLGARSCLDPEPGTVAMLEGACAT